METLQEIKLFLESACERFHELSFKVGYGAFKSTFIIEVAPSSFYKGNDEFAEMEYDFSKRFELESHPGHSVIFKAEDNALLKVEDTILEVRHTPVSYKKSNISFEFPSDLDGGYMDNKYSFAA